MFSYIVIEMEEKGRDISLALTKQVSKAKQFPSHQQILEDSSSRGRIINKH